MRYWDDEKKPVVKEINKENICQLLNHIKDGYLPDWNYEKHYENPEDEEETSMPDEYYPLHIAMEIARKAVEAQGDSFFEAMKKEYARY